MSHLPIKRMTLYKHGVGFFERRATLSAEKVELSFREEEMNDILKSITAIDWDGGQVLGIDYATPQSREERLAGCSIRLDDDRSLQDLLVGLRGRRVTLRLDQGETATGTLLGVDEAPERQPLATALVSLLRDETEQVGVVTLARVQGVEILDERGASDLRFFLQTALSQEAFRSVTIRLTPGDHDLSVSYIAPAPTWRVSYRLVAEPERGGGRARRGGRSAPPGLGDLRQPPRGGPGGHLALARGGDADLVRLQPLHALHTRAPGHRGRGAGRRRTGQLRRRARDEAGAEPEAMPARRRWLAMLRTLPLHRRGGRIDIDAMQHAAAVRTRAPPWASSSNTISATPVTVGRGHSAMAPIAQATLAYTKDLIYNGQKMATHPVATLRLKNETGLTLERGPVTVIEGGNYVGEAMLPFTVIEDEIVVPYAVELGVKVGEQNGTTRETRGIVISGAYLQFDEWETRWREYRINNTTAKPVTVLIEHPRTEYYVLFDTPEPKERTEDQLRFEVDVPRQDEVTLKVQERRLLRRREEIQKQSYQGLQQYLKQGLLDARAMAALTELLKLWEAIEDQERELTLVEKEREKIYKAQQQIQGNMGALGQTGKEGALRARYVEQLEGTEGELRALSQRETRAQAEWRGLRARSRRGCGRCRRSLAGQQSEQGSPASGWYSRSSVHRAGFETM